MKNTFYRKINCIGVVVTLNSLAPESVNTSSRLVLRAAVLMEFDLH